MTTKRHIGFLIHTLDIGGAEQHLLRLVSGLDRQAAHFSIYVLVRDSRHHLLPAFSALSNLTIEISPWSKNDPRTIGWLSQTFRKRRVDLLLSFLPRSQILGSYLRSRKLVAKHIATERGDRLTRDPWLGIFDKKFVFRFSDRIVCNSHFGAHVVAQKGYPQSQIDIIPNGIDLETLSSSPQASLRKELHIPPEAFVAGLIARLDPLKQIDHFLHAVALVEKQKPGRMRGLIIGDGPERLRLEALAAQLGLAERVLFTGFRENPIQFCHDVDCGVLCSKSEGFPNVVLEWMAIGKPVVASRIASLPEILTDGKEGFLVAPNLRVGLAQSFMTLMESPETAKQMGSRGRKTVQERFTLRQIVERYEALFREILST